MSNTLDVINWRYATKKFDTKRMPDETFNILLESLRLSASSYGLQGWKFVVVENKELRKQLVPHAWGQEQVVDASHLIVLARPTRFTKDDVQRFVQHISEVRNIPLESLEGYKQMMDNVFDKLDQEQIGIWLSKQIYLALGTLLTTAAFEGIDACPMEGFEPEKFDEILGLTERGLNSVVVCPVGYRHADDAYANLPKVRYSQEDVTLVL